MGNVVQVSPIRFSMFHTDINFSRAFYPIIVINIMYALWFVILVTVKRFVLKKDLA